MAECEDPRDHRVIDAERDCYQTLGVIPASVVERLWPGFVPQSYEVAINPVYVSRHMRKSADYMERAAAFAQHIVRLPALFSDSVVFARYDGVDRGEAGITAFAPIGGGAACEPTQYIAIGVRLFTAKLGRGKPNYVTTVMPPVTEARLRKMLRRRDHCLVEDGDVVADPGSE